MACAVDVDFQSGSEFDDDYESPDEYTMKLKATKNLTRSLSKLRKEKQNDVDR